MLLIHCDLETYSEISLKEYGVLAYSLHDTTGVWCLSYAIGNGPVQTWVPGEEIPECFLEPFIMVAHNYRFEAAIWANIMNPLGFAMPHRYRCTMAMALRDNRPAALAKVAPAIGLGEVKDEDGGRLMVKMANRIRYNPDKKNSAAAKAHEFNLPKLIEYCEQDVRTERDVEQYYCFSNTPAFVREFRLDQKINDRGIKVDVQSAKAIASVIESEAKELQAQLPALTFGAVEKPTEVKKMTTWLRTQGYPHKTLSVTHVDEVLRSPGGLSTNAYKVLEIRKLGSLGSLAKFGVMARARDPKTDRMHDLFQLYGASQTGRWAGRLVQIQNLPRMDMTDEEIEYFIGLFREGNIDAIKRAAGDVFRVAKSLIRPMFIAEDGYSLVVSDLAQIECRTLAWLAGCNRLLDQFSNTDIDPYSEMAGAIYSKPASEFGKGTDGRQLGKAALLGAGYGMGASKFLLTAGAGIEMEENLAQHVISTYRETYSEIPALWQGFENAFMTQIMDANAPCSIRVGQCSVMKSHDTIIVVLPSGRSLKYHSIRNESGRLTFLNSNGLRTDTYGAKIVENVTQAVARDVLMDRMFVLDEAGIDIVGHVHDEVILEIPDERIDTDKIRQIMIDSPSWARSLPIDVETASCKRYTK